MRIITKMSFRRGSNMHGHNRGCRALWGEGEQNMCGGYQMLSGALVYEKVSGYKEREHQRRADECEGRIMVDAF